MPAQRHRAFAIVLGLAAALRVVAMLGYRPARVYTDSVTYLGIAAHPHPSRWFDPSGYPMLVLAPLRPLHSLALVVAVQHTLGLATGLLVYAVARRNAVPAGIAIAAAVPQLFDASFLQLEEAVLGDTLFIFLVVAAVAVLLWSPEISGRAGAGAGLLLAMATLTRTVALPLLLLVLGYLLVRRAWRPLSAAAVVGVIPLVLYASWYAADYGRFTIVGGDGVALWARTMTFADCRAIAPPAAEAPLCPNGVRQDAAEEYVWAPDSPINLMPGGKDAADDATARSFALRAIAAQPLAYAGDVARDVSLAFHWTPARHPARVTPAFGFKTAAAPPPGDPVSTEVIAGYDRGAGAYRPVSPYASFLRAYQYPAYLRGPLLAVILVVGAFGRRALVPWIAAVTLLVLPVAVLDFDHRYVLPVVPLACLAAALALVRPKVLLDNGLQRLRPGGNGPGGRDAPSGFPPPSESFETGFGGAP